MRFLPARVQLPEELCAILASEGAGAGGIICDFRQPGCSCWGIMFDFRQRGCRRRSDGGIHAVCKLQSCCFPCRAALELRRAAPSIARRLARNAFPQAVAPSARPGCACRPPRLRIDRPACRARGSASSACWSTVASACGRASRTCNHRRPTRLRPKEPRLRVLEDPHRQVEVGDDLESAQRCGVALSKAPRAASKRSGALGAGGSHLPASQQPRHRFPHRAARPATSSRQGPRTGRTAGMSLLGRAFSCGGLEKGMARKPAKPKARERSMWHLGDLRSNAKGSKFLSFFR